MTLSNLRTANSLVENAAKINNSITIVFNKDTLGSEHVRISDNLHRIAHVERTMSLIKVSCFSMEIR
jgi:hypothetical protein